MGGFQSALCFFCHCAALRRCLNEGRQDNLPAIKIALKEARKEIAHGNSVVQDCYERIRRMGLDCDEIEESMMGDAE